MTDPGMTNRHLSPEGFRDYLRSGAPSLVKLDGSPVVYLVIDPMLRKVGLRTPALRHAVPDLADYQHMSAAVVHWNGGPWCEFRIEGELMLEAYPMLCAIADRIQLRSMGFGAAVVDGLRCLGELLAGRRRLSAEEEIGLFGELMLLRHLLRGMAAADAVAAWRGPEGEEHDFALPDGDIEVKSTTSETRSHWIHGVGQLEPTPGRRLRLLSLQLTGAGAGGASLVELIEDLRALLRTDGTTESFDRKLARLNWRDASADLYTTRFRLRTDPAAYDVDGAFPALTPSLLEAGGLDQSRVRQVRYLIELDGLSPSSDARDLLLNIGG